MENLFRVMEGEEELMKRRCVVINGAMIIGAGPSGLATAACLKQQGVPFVVVEREECIASLWKKRTYDRLKLHLPKQFCQLPNLPFPEDFPEYPTKRHFIDYLDSYALRFGISPQFGESVLSARFDRTSGFWRVSTSAHAHYVCRWLVVATGENAECIVPDLDGLASEFCGDVVHASDYKSGEKYAGKNVLVVGCGNSGMELSLDLCDHNASPVMVVRSSVHVLPREVFGRSTFEIACRLMAWLPLWLVDKIVLLLTWLALGDVEKYGLKRPPAGPLELKNKRGKTPVLDIGALDKIKSGKIKVVPGIKRFSKRHVELVDGRVLEIDSVILATGYRSNVPSWLQEGEFFSKNGFPKAEYQQAWKGNDGLYAVGFSRRGLSGASSDAVKIAEDIAKVWRQETSQPKKRTFACHRRCISQF